MKAVHPMLLFMLMLLGIFVCCALFIRPESRFTEEPAVDTAAGADAGQMDAGGPEAVETPEKVVYLTFDDGPSAVTEDILRLQRHRHDTVILQITLQLFQ